MNNSDRIRVMLVDDNEMVRMSIAVFLETCDDVELVAEAGDGQKAIELSAQTCPDVILMDLVMPGMDGVAATRIIHQRQPTTRIVVLSSSVEPSLIDGALEAGAVGYLHKSAKVDDLLNVIRPESEETQIA
jgi:NarL family two-component system response regulator LiaR